MDSAAVAAFYDILKKILTLHSDISAYCLFLFPSIACDANIFPCIVPVTSGDVQLFGFRQINPGFFHLILGSGNPEASQLKTRRVDELTVIFCGNSVNWTGTRQEKRNNKISTP